MIANIIRGWNAMSPYRKIRRVFMIGLALFGLWALTPYLYNRRVDEAFPAAAAAPTAMAAMAEQPTAAMAERPTAAIAAMAEQPTAAMADSMQPTAAMADAMAEQPTAMPEQPAGPVALAQGSFIPGSTPGDTAAGTATLYKLENNSHVLRLEDFSTTNGPDLFVVLSGQANPDAEGIGEQGAYVQLAALKGNQGNQNYELPAELDLSKYQSVVIWCRTFNIVFGYAPLQPAG